MKKKSLFICMIFCVCSLFMSGCWDKVEIDRRAFISAIGIDAGEDIDKEKVIQSSEPEFSINENEFKKLKVTYSFPDLKKAKEGTVETQSIPVDAYSLTDAMSKFTVKSSRALYMGHTRLILLSSDILEHKDTVKEIVDYIQRQPDFNRTVLVLVCEGKAEDYLKFKPTMEKSLESYMMGLMRNSSKNNIIPQVNLNEFLFNLSGSGNCLVPKIKIDKNKNELLLEDMAIIKNYKIVGELSEDDVAQRQMLKGKLKSGKRVILYKKHPIDYIIDGNRSKIKFYKANDKLIFNIKVDLEGKVNGHYLETQLSSKEDLDKIQKSFNKVIKNETERFIEVSKEKYGADFIGLDEYLKKYHPKVWDEVKDDWDKEFKNSIITVDVQTDVRRVGTVK